MGKKIGKILFITLTVMLLLMCVGLSTSLAATQGDYTYTVKNDKATITDVDEDISGDVVLPEKLDKYPVTAIGASAFYHCYGLTSITLPDSVTSIGAVAFSSCRSLTSITIPDTVTSIGDNAFLNCDALTSITIPDSVTSIGASVFSACDALTSITIPDSVTSIGHHAFSSCRSLTSITIPDSVTSIGHHAFSSCSALTSITIPDSVTSIGDEAFSDCDALKSVTIGDSVTSIGDKAFQYCYDLRNVYYTGSPEQWGNTEIGEANTCLTNATIHYNYCDHKYTFSLSDTSYVYNGYKKAPTVTVKDKAGNTLKNGTDYIVTYADGRINVGTYNVTVKMIGNYTGTKTLSFKINPINISTCNVKLSATSFTYNGAVRTPTVTVTNSYGTKLTKDKHYTVTYAAGRKNVGTYNVKVTMKGNYTGTKTLSFKINPVNVSKCDMALSNTSYTYDGTTKIPNVIVLNHNGTKLTESSYTVTYDSGRKNVGTYNVTVTMKGNYTGTKTLSFKINPMDISKCNVKLSATSVTYNAKVRTPTVTVTNPNGAKLTKDTHYTVTYSSGRRNVGTYNVTVKLKGNYTGTKTLSFKITPMDISKCTVKLSATSVTYNGEVRTPTFSIVNPNGAKLTKDTHYTVTYSSGRKNVGTYKITVKLKGNYTGTKTLTFKITPPKTTVASLKAGTKSITVNLTKKTTQVTGYQIQYATNKDFTNAKTKTVTSNSTVKTTLAGLTANKTYYVRVRTYKTVNDVKYYSGWSAYKYVKTK